MKMARVMNADCPPLDTDKAHRDTRPSFIVCRHHRAKKIKDTSTTRTKPLSSINNPRPPALIHTLPGKLNSDDYSATCKKHSRNMHKVILAYCNNKKSQTLWRKLYQSYNICTFNRRYPTSPTSPTVYFNPYQTLSTSLQSPGRSLRPVSSICRKVVHVHLSLPPCKHVP